MAPKQALTLFGLFLLWTLTGGCTHFGHYAVNEPLNKYEPGYGYIAQNMGLSDNLEEPLLVLSFSGGGTRAAAFSYGVLEELRAPEVTLDGRKRRLVNEVDVINFLNTMEKDGALGMMVERWFKDGSWVSQLR